MTKPIPEPYYDTALICENGHIINTSMNRKKYLNSEYCSKCGAKTISQCPKCSENIRGKLIGVQSLLSIKLPQNCHACGVNYPWTKKKLDAIEEALKLIDEFSQEERNDLIISAHDLVSDTPRTKLATMKVMKYGEKIKSKAWDVAYDMIVDISSEVAKKMLMGE